jgi:hypothetical protein
MKPLLLLLSGCFCLANSQAQEEQKSLPELAPDGPRVYKLPKDLNATILPDSTIKLQDLNFLKNKKPGVYRLPQDNMPCIVPDSGKTVRIPNAWRGSRRVPYQSNSPRIPNPGPKQWVPTPISHEHSNTDTK